jgi:hypothetical protein
VGWILVAQGANEGDEVHALQPASSATADLDAVDRGVGRTAQDTFGDPVDQESNRMFLSGAKVAEKSISTKPALKAALSPGTEPEYPEPDASGLPPEEDTNDDKHDETTQSIAAMDEHTDKLNDPVWDRMLDSIRQMHKDVYHSKQVLIENEMDDQAVEADEQTVHDAVTQADDTADDIDTIPAASVEASASSSSAASTAEAQDSFRHLLKQMAQPSCQRFADGGEVSYIMSLYTAKYEKSDGTDGVAIDSSSKAVDTHRDASDSQAQHKLLRSVAKEQAALDPVQAERLQDETEPRVEELATDEEAQDARAAKTVDTPNADSEEDENSASEKEARDRTLALPRRADQDSDNDAEKPDESNEIQTDPETEQEARKQENLEADVKAEAKDQAAKLIQQAKGVQDMKDGPEKEEASKKTDCTSRRF